MRGGSLLLLLVSSSSWLLPGRELRCRPGTLLDISLMAAAIGRNNFVKTVGTEARLKGSVWNS